MERAGVISATRWSSTTPSSDGPSRPSPSPFAGTADMGEIRTPPRASPRSKPSSPPPVTLTRWSGSACRTSSGSAGSSNSCGAVVGDRDQDLDRARDVTRHRAISTFGPTSLEPPVRPHFRRQRQRQRRRPTEAGASRDECGMPSWARGERHGLETRACRAPGRRRGRAKAFYLEQAGFDLLVDHREGETFRVVQVTRRARRAPLPSWPTPGPPARSRASTSSSTTSTPHTTSSPPVGPDRARSSTSTPGRRSRPRPRAPGLQLVPQFRRPDGTPGCPRSAGVLRPAGRAPGLSRVLAGGPGPVSRRGGRTASVPGHDGVVGRPWPAH